MIGSHSEGISDLTSYKRNKLFSLKAERLVWIKKTEIHNILFISDT